MTTDRAGYIAGLRALAELLDTHDDLPLPDTDSVHWYLFGSSLSDATQKAEAARIVRILGGQHDKEDTSGLFRFKGSQHGLGTQVIVDRAAVCERVVVATEQVTKQVPDPDAPLVEVTETVETVEWRCKPLLLTDDATALRVVEPVTA